MIKTITIGYPRIGPKRELKKALEKFISKSLNSDLRKLTSPLPKVASEKLHDSPLKIA